MTMMTMMMIIISSNIIIIIITLLPGDWLRGLSKSFQSRSQSMPNTYYLFYFYNPICFILLIWTLFPSELGNSIRAELSAVDAPPDQPYRRVWAVSAPFTTVAHKTQDRTNTTHSRRQLSICLICLWHRTF